MAGNLAEDDEIPHLWQAIRLNSKSKQDILDVAGAVYAKAEVKAYYDFSGPGYGSVAAEVEITHGNESRIFHWHTCCDQENYAQSLTTHAALFGETMSHTALLNWDMCHPWTERHVDTQLNIRGIAVNTTVCLPYDQWARLEPRDLTVDVKGVQINLHDQVQAELNKVARLYNDRHPEPPLWVVETATIVNLALGRRARARSGRPEFARTPRGYKKLLTAGLQ